MVILVLSYLDKNSFEFSFLADSVKNLLNFLWELGVDLHMSPLPFFSKSTSNAHMCIWKSSEAWYEYESDIIVRRETSFSGYLHEINQDRSILYFQNSLFGVYLCL